MICTIHELIQMRIPKYGLSEQNNNLYLHLAYRYITSLSKLYGPHIFTTVKWHMSLICIQK
jgi:hypothetical protein